MVTKPPYPFPGGVQGDEPPPILPGQPGHLAWSRWIQEYVRRLGEDSGSAARWDDFPVVSDEPALSLTPYGTPYVTGAGSLRGLPSLSLATAQAIDSKIGSAGGTIAGPLNVPEPTAPSSAATKAYVDRRGSFGTASSLTKVNTSWTAGRFSTTYVLPLTRFDNTRSDVTHVSANNSLRITTPGTYLARYTVETDSGTANILRKIWMEYKQSGSTTWIELPQAAAGVYANAGYAGGGTVVINASVVLTPLAGNEYRLVGNMSGVAAGAGYFLVKSFQMLFLG